MSGLITPEAANSCQSPPAVPHNVALATAPITHDPTTQARPLRRSVITRCGLRSGNYRIPQLGIVLHHGPGPVYQVFKGQTSLCLSSLAGAALLRLGAPPGICMPRPARAAHRTTPSASLARPNIHPQFHLDVMLLP